MKKFLIFMIILPFPKFNIIRARLESNGLIFSGEIIMNFSELLSKFSELSIGKKTKKKKC